MTNMPGSLPMLPGNVYADPTVTRYHKTQLLGVKDGAIQGKTKSLPVRPSAHSVVTDFSYALAVFVYCRENDLFERAR